MKSLIVSFLGGPFFRYCVFPLFGTLFRIFVRRLQHSKPFKREDFEVGLDEMCDALLMFVALILERAVAWTKTTQSLHGIDPATAMDIRVRSDIFVDQLAWAGGSIFVIFSLLVVLALIKHDYGTDANGRPTWFLGIILPDLVAFGSMAAVAMYFSSAS